MAVGIISGALSAAKIIRWVAAGAATAGGKTLAKWLIDEAKDIDYEKIGENSVLKNITATEIKKEETNQKDSIPITNQKDSIPITNQKDYEIAKNNTTLDDYENNIAKIGKAMNNLENNKKEEKEPLPPISGMDSILPGKPTGEQGAIQDTTDMNLGTNNMTQLDWLKWAEEQQKLRWEREDEIRRETQAREDSAWERGIEDMLKSGINPNLVGAQPAESGGGITQASGLDTSTLTNQMNIDLKEMQQIIDNAFKGNENEKDRFVEIFGKIMNYVGILMITKGKK